MLSKKKIGLIGAGKMGEVLIRGLLASGTVKKDRVFVSDTDKKRLDLIKKKYRINATSENAKVALKSDIIILAVKPKDMHDVLSQISASIDNKKLIISIAAGITTKSIERHLKKNAVVIRAMPNAPALVGEGITAISKGRFVKEKDVNAAKHIFSAVGYVVEVKEDKMDLITAISGSGPAYIMYFIEAFLVVAMEFGLTWELALEIILQTVFGSAKLLEKSRIAPAEIREMVTSKGGTTEAALEVFRKHKLDTIIRNGVRAAVRRAKVLSGGLNHGNS